MTLLFIHVSMMSAFLSSMTLLTHLQLATDNHPQMLLYTIAAKPVVSPLCICLVGYPQLGPFELYPANFRSVL